MRISKGKAYFSIVHSTVCIVGGGTASLNLSSKLAKDFGATNLRIFEPSSVHYYQPGFTMIGGNLCKDNVAVRPTRELFASEIPLTNSAVKHVDPENKILVTDRDQKFSYDQLILATGFKLDWHRIKGALQALQDPNCPVGSIYSYEFARKTRELGKNFIGGKAIFTQPELPIKCAGAPQKIMYLLSQKWQKTSVKTQVIFKKNADVMFGVPKYSAALTQIASKYGITTQFKKRLVQVRGKQKIALFLDLSTNKIEQEKFDFLHLVPPMVPHSYIRESGLGDEKGFCNVDKHTLQHKKYQNIWSLGDCSSIPCSKTAAAIFSQTQILRKNLNAVAKKKQIPGHKYDGYSSCPIFVGGNKLMLAEFKFDGVLDETFFKDQERPRTLFYHMKKDFFPFVYWNIMPRGMWAGRHGLSLF